MHPSVARILAAPLIAQRTPAWYEFRRIRLTASDVTKVLAKGGKSRTNLFLEKTLQKTAFSGNEYTESGAVNEDVALEKYKERFPGVVVHSDLPAVVHPKFDELAASLDAVTSDGINLEIKTIHGKKNKTVPKRFFDQVQFQMEVADLDISHLVSYYVNEDELVVDEIVRDREWFKNNVGQFLCFVVEVRSWEPFDLEKVSDSIIDGIVREEVLGHKEDAEKA